MSLLAVCEKSAKSLSWALSLDMDSVEDSFWHLFGEIWGKVKKFLRLSHLYHNQLRLEICNKKIWPSRSDTYVIFLALCQKKDFKEIHFVKKDLKHFFKEKKIMKVESRIGSTLLYPISPHRWHWQLSVLDRTWIKLSHQAQWWESISKVTTLF